MDGNCCVIGTGGYGGAPARVRPEELLSLWVVQRAVWGMVTVVLRHAMALHLSPPVGHSSDLLGVSYRFSKVPGLTLHFGFNSVFCGLIEV